MKKLPAWTQHFVQPFFISMLMSAIVSGITTVRTVGFAALPDRWPVAWLLSWAVAFPAILIVLPIVRKLVSYIVEQ